MVPGLAWALPVGIMLMVNHHTMGSFTGYDSTHESEFGAAFQWKFFWQNWEKAIRIFDDVGLFFVLPFAVAGIAMLFRKSWRVGLMPGPLGCAGRDSVHVVLLVAGQIGGVCAVLPDLSAGTFGWCCVLLP